ncbi:hypothetical protein [Vibrio rumoiensis]|uniref:hypothetical protein n=1 Tax=Vibrio rumoiensis TaxID=76258 RepID=UPI003AA80ED4
MKVGSILPNSQYQLLHQTLIQDITKITTSIKEPKPTINTSDLFDPFITAFLAIGSYNTYKWHSSFTQEIWKNLEVIAQSDLCTNFLERIEKQLDQHETNEPLHFLKSELLISSKTQPRSKLKQYSESLIEKYPSNLEFQHNYAHLLIDMNKSPSSKDNLVALNIYRKYIQSFASYTPHIVLVNTYNIDVKFYQKLRDKKEYIHAQKWLDSMAQFKPYNDDALLRNNTITLSEMLKERMHLEGTMKEQLKNYQEELDKIRAAQSGQNIQQLSIFTAIITFVITAAMSNLSTNGGFGSLAVFGVILIMFVVTASLISTPPKDFFADIRGKLLTLFSLICLFLVGAVYVAKKEAITFNCIFNCNSFAYFPVESVDNNLPSLHSNQ